MNVYESVLKNSDIIMFIVNPNGMIIDSNRYTMELFDDSNMVGKYFYSLVDDGSHNSIKSTVFYKKGTSMEVNFKAGYGRVQPTYINVSIIDDFMLIIGFTTSKGGDALIEMSSLLDDGSSDSYVLEYEDKRAWQLRNIDPVTGLYNKEFFKTMFESMYSKAAATGGNVGVICFDINGFNDMIGEYGQEKANSMLAGFAQVILTSTRSADFAIRYDESFILLIENTNREVLQRISERIENTAHKNLSISLSTGWACTVDNNITDKWDLMRLANKKADRLKSDIPEDGESNNEC